MSIDARNQDIRARRALGHTLKEIGTVYGLSRERVRQILGAVPDPTKRTRPRTPPEVLAAVRERHEARKKARRVYFMKPIGLPGPIKIGCSNKPDSRLIALSTWSPFRLEIVATIPGSFDTEKWLHECFSEELDHNEWFHASERLLRFVTFVVSGAEPTEALNLALADDLARAA